MLWIQSKTQLYGTHERHLKNKMRKTKNKDTKIHQANGNNKNGVMTVSNNVEFKQKKIKWQKNSSFKCCHNSQLRYNCYDYLYTK